MIGGSLYVNSTYGFATGVQIIADGAIALTVDGNVSSSGNTATGLFSASFSGSDNTIDVGGNVTVSADALAQGVLMLGGNMTLTIAGQTSVSSYAQSAVGLLMVDGDNVDINVGGVHAYSRNSYAVGINTVAATGSQQVVVAGDVYAGSAGSYARAVTLDGTSASAIYLHVTGNVSAQGQDSAYGVYAYGGNIAARVGGDVNVHANAGLAQGVFIHGDAYAYVGGSVNVSTGSGKAIGVKMTGAGDQGVYVGGDVEAYGTTGATGVVAGGGNLSVAVHGNTIAKTSIGAAYGVELSPGVGDQVYASLGGVSASSAGNAIAVDIVGSAIGTDDLKIFGNVTASSLTGNAQGLSIITDDSDVSVKFYSGGIHVKGNDAATGASITGNDVSLSVAGDIYAAATLGNAYGVTLSGQESSLYVGGNVVALALGGGGATAVSVTGVGYESVHVDGNVEAKGNATVIGVTETSTADSAAVYVGGGVTASTTIGDATGVALEAKYGTGSIHIGGGVDVSTLYGNATGVSIHADVSTYVGGSVHVTTQSDVATGVESIAVGSVVDPNAVTVKGDIYSNT